MTIRLDEIGKADKNAKNLPEEAQRIFVDVYNKDFAWRAQESHALKAAWRAVREEYTQDGESWVKT